jgi:hypothetical protein
MTIRQQLLLIRQQNAEIIRLLSVIARQPQCGCLPPNVQFPPDLPPIPLLPPVVPDTPYIPGGDPVLCKRIQREIDNILTVWEQMIDIAEIAGVVSVAALAALIGGALAPETAGLSAVGLAALAAGLSALISEAGTEIGNVPQPIRERAAQAAYNARSGGAASASSAALQVLRDEQPVIITEGAFVIYWRLWGGLRRAFDLSADIGDWTPYPDICADCYGHVDYIDFGFPILERIYRWAEPIPLLTEVPGLPGSAGPGRYFRVPDGTIFQNNSPHAVWVSIWNYVPTLHINVLTQPGQSVTLFDVNAGYAVTLTDVLCPPGTLRLCIP